MESLVIPWSEKRDRSHPIMSIYPSLSDQITSDNNR